MSKQLTITENGSEKVLKIPTITELIEEYSDEGKEDQRTLVALLNTPPSDKWLKPHPTAKRKNDKGETVACKYLPTEKVEYLLSRIFTKWWIEVLEYKLIANSVAVSVRLFVVNPITGQIDHNDGVGAVAIQTDSGSGAMDWNKAKSAGVQMAFPAAKTYAFKDAAESFGRIFGKDINRDQLEDYKDLAKSKEFIV
jgi:hypothetical protein